LDPASLGPKTLEHARFSNDDPGNMGQNLNQLDEGLSDEAGRTAKSVAAPSGVGIYLYWIPLGAGGSGFVRMNGRIYEAIKARVEQRERLDLYHTALEVRLPEGSFIVETMWPSPDGDTASRGVVVEAPVFAHWLSLSRVFRYEVRCWRDGVLPDADDAVGGAQMLSDDPDLGRHVVRLARSVPDLTWGRDQLAVGDMWNSNSVISWLLTRSGLPTEIPQPPARGRAPGWEAGIAVALRRQQVENGKETREDLDALTDGISRVGLCTASQVHCTGEHGDFGLRRASQESPFGHRLRTGSPRAR
jgi:hypothetical protein